MAQSKFASKDMINMPTTVGLRAGKSISAARVQYHEIPPTRENDEEVRVIDMKEYKGVAQCLAEAFAVDEVVRYFVDTDDMASYDEDYKMKLHTEILEYVTAAHILTGVVTTIGDDHDAVALWMPPGKESDDWLTFFRSGMWRLWYKLSPEGKTRFYEEFIPLLHDTFFEALAPYKGEAWYLVYLGTKPGSRGKGYARKLIEHGLQMADATNHATYLESSAAVNVPYYQKFGFQVQKDIHLMRSKRAIPLTIMVRPPLSRNQYIQDKGM